MGLNNWPLCIFYIQFWFQYWREKLPTGWRWQYPWVVSWTFQVTFVNVCQWKCQWKWAFLRNQLNNQLTIVYDVFTCKVRWGKEAQTWPEGQWSKSNWWRWCQEKGSHQETEKITLDNPNNGFQEDSGNRYYVIHIYMGGPKQDKTMFSTQTITSTVDPSPRMASLTFTLISAS